MGDSLNVLFLNYEYPPVGGGGGVLCRDLAEELVRAGHRVTVITSGFAGLPGREIQSGVEIHRVPVMMRKSQNAASIVSMLSYVPGAIRKARELIVWKGFDVMHTWFAIPTGPVGAALARRYRLPNVLYLLGGDVYDPSKRLSPHRNPVLKRVVRRVIEAADGVIALSSDLKERARRYYGTTRPIEVIPAGIRRVEVEGDRARLGLECGAFVLSTIGRLIPRKNVDELLGIVQSLQAKQATPRLIVIGDGPERERLERQAEALGLNGSVRFVGRVSDEEKHAWLAASDAYVSTAQHEGFGIVFLEAMSAGLPVVCYDQGGQTDFLQDGCTGFVVRHGDHAVLAERLERLAADAPERHRISEHNRAYVRRFDIGAIGERVAAMLRTNIAAAAAAAAANSARRRVLGLFSAGGSLGLGLALDEAEWFACVALAACKHAAVFIEPVMSMAA